jgi:hypothetical protein
VLNILLKLARSELRIVREAQTATPSADDETPADSRQAWLIALQEERLPLPDDEPLTLPNVTFPFKWQRHMVAAGFDAVPEEVRAMLAPLGWVALTLPADPQSDEGREALARLKELLEGS